MTRLGDKREKEIHELKKIIHQKLTQKEVKSVIASNAIVGETLKDKRDIVEDGNESEFSKVGEESAIRDKENILDFVVATSHFDPNSLQQALGQELISEDAFNTFVSVEFYDHDTKTTEVSSGFKANYAT